MSTREADLEQQVKILSDRLALALIPLPEGLQGSVLLGSRAKDRKLMREMAGYRVLRSAIAEAVMKEMQRLEEKERAAA